MGSEELAAQTSLLEQIKLFSDSRHWGEIRPALFERMKKLPLPDLEGLLQELKSVGRHVNLRSHVIEYLKRHKIHSE